MARMTIRSLLRALKGNYARQIGVLMLGNAGAGLLPILVSPLITRLYSPVHFGTYALYFSLTVIFAALASGNYEKAIILPEREEEALTIAAVVVLLSAAVCGLLFLLLLLVNFLWGGGGEERPIAGWLFFIPLSVLLLNVYQAFYYLNNRGQQYRLMAFSKIVQMGVVAVGYVLLGFLGLGGTGLIVGDIFGYLAAAALMARSWRRRSPAPLAGLTWARIKTQARRYRRFPQYSLQANIVYVVTNQTPPILMSNFFGSAVVGFLNLSQKVLGSPLAVISRSIADVFRERASSEYRERGNCRSIYVKTFGGLLLISVVPFLVLFLAAPELFSFVFGPSWRIAGEYTRILSVMYFFRFSASPMGYVFLITEKQNYDLIFQVVLFALTILSIMAGVWQASPRLSLLYFSLSYSFMYVVYAALSFKLAKGPAPAGHAR